MDNPYEAPQSNIDNGVVVTRSKTGWKIYFWIMLPLSLFATISTFIDPDAEYTLIDKVIDCGVYPIILLGIYGFAYNQRFITKTFWKVWILVALASDAYSLSDIFEVNELGFTTNLELYAYVATIMVLLIPLMLIQYVCLYGYAFKSPTIWNANEVMHQKH